MEPAAKCARSASDGSFGIDNSGGWVADFVQGLFKPARAWQLKGQGVRVYSAFKCVVPNWCNHGSTFTYNADKDEWQEFDHEAGRMSWSWIRMSRKKQDECKWGEGPLFLGFDLSTQSCKALVMDTDLNILGVSKVHFDTDLPHYETLDGCHRGEDGKVTSPTRIWIEAMELALDRLRDGGCPFNRIVAVSGSGQQHGSVYWSPAGVESLQQLNSAQGPALVQLRDGAFATVSSPIWMDTSTTLSCKEMTTLAGGSLKVAEWTGSTSQERFTAHHFRHFITQHGLAGCGALQLVSSFGTSLLRGDVVPVDFSDAAGMNLMDIRSHRWRDELLSFVAPGQVDALRKRLAEPQNSWDICGSLHNFWVERYGFAPEAKLVAWSGDNPCAVVGNGLMSEGDIAISLGTSDTALCVIPELPKEPLAFGHIFPHPILKGRYWSMLCYTNGDITRRRVRDDFFAWPREEENGDEWKDFSEAMRNTPPGNDGYAGMYFTMDEITPAINGGPHLRCCVANGKPELLDAFDDKKRNARAVIEMRALTIKRHITKLMPELMAKSSGDKSPQLLVTGGASTNPDILQVFADVFQRPVRCLELAEGAAFGAAVRALHGFQGADKDTGVLAEKLLSKSKVCVRPNPDAAKMYDVTAQANAALEEKALNERSRSM